MTRNNKSVPVVVTHVHRTSTRRLDRVRRSTDEALLDAVLGRNREPDPPTDPDQPAQEQSRP